MSLSPIIGAASQVLGLFGGSSSPSKTTTNPTSVLDSSGNVDLSQAAQLFSNLQNLSQSDSSKFKQLTAQIASQLQTDAQSVTGSQQSFLSTLASQFNTASQTGSISSIQPQAALPGSFQSGSNGSTGQHGGHHHHHLSSQAAYQLSSDITNAASSTGSSVSNSFQQTLGL